MKKQKHLKTIEKRLLALLLCTSMIVTTAPATARAENEDVNATTAPADTSNQETLDIITTWQWNDEEDILDPETGSLALPGASEQTPAYFDDVTELLPTQILATVENAEEPITLGDWECDNYPEEGAYTGSYTFTATLPEGYALSEEAEALEVLVELGGAQTYESAEGETVGAFTVTGGTLGTDYTYADGVLTIKTGTSITIKNTDPSTATTDRIMVASGISADITLAGVNINVSSLFGTAAFKIADNSTGNVTITLADGSENTLESGMNCAGLQKNGSVEGIGKLTIQGGTEGTGKLTAIGGMNGAGIGGGNSDGANITISGGTVTATGGMNGAGIGGGAYGSGSNITISGGSVKAVEGANAKDIGGGYNGGGAVTPTNGTDSVYLLTIANSDSEEVLIDGVSYKPVNHKVTDSNDTNLYAYLTGAEHRVQVGNKTIFYTFDSENSTFAVAPLTVYPTNGGTLTYGTDYTYESNLLTIKSATPVTIRNTAPNTATTDRIEVAGGVSANITLAGVNIATSSDNAAFKIADDSTGNVTITLADGSENTLESGMNCAGLQKNGSVEGIGKLTIQGGTNGTGTLTATSIYSGAGIGGGGDYGSGSNITISGGTVTATGGNYGAGIGGSKNGSGSNITISGGTVTATGGNYGAGIGGGGDYGSGSDIKISGGSVKASGAHKIGGGSGKDAVTPTSNGTTPVYLLEIANNSGAAIMINNNAYPAEHTYYDFESSQYVTEKKIYAYLPAKTVEDPNVIKVGTETTKYIYDNSKWLIVSTGAYDVDGFCTNYEWKDGSLVLKDGIADGHTDCNGYEPATDSDNDGVYEIGNAGQLYWFADKVNNNNANYGSAKAVLTADITVNERVLVNGELSTSENGSFRSWMPIGNDANPYTGTFDGQEYTVSGLYVNDVDKKNVGLFGYIQSGGSIKKVGVVDSYFNGNKSVGGVCGLNQNGTIENCYNKSYVSGTENIGGVCGYNYAANNGIATIENCHNEGKVSGSDYVGGVCGFNNDDPEGVATIEYCYNTGEVSSVYHVGGVCGWNRSVHGLSEIANCYNMGKVSGTNYVGGVCGYNYSNGGMSDIRKCFNTGKVGGTGDSVGGVCGLNSQESGASATVTNCYYIAGCNTEDTRFTCEEGTSKTATWFASGEATYLLNGSTSENPVWYQNIDDGTADAYPVLDSNHGTVYYGYEDCDESKDKIYSNTELYSTRPAHDYTDNGFCTVCDAYQPATDSDSDGVYEIGNAGQLYWFAALVNGTNGLIQNLGANAVLTADITVNTGVFDENGDLNTGDFRSWTPIGWYDNANSVDYYYSGTFNGQNHTVSGLYFNDSNVDYVGLFGATGSSSEISNVGVVDSYFRGKNRVGGVCGEKYGTMENCYSASTVSGTNAVGGVCGNNANGKLLNCYNTGAVIGTSWYIGGVCGIVNDGTIQNCYSTGIVGGSSDPSVGGVCGHNHGTISNCYFDSSKCDKNAVGINNSTVEKTEGKTAAQFASGEVCYLLNGSSSENPVWYQNIDRDGETADAYPVLDSNHGMVYQCTPCTAVYSNTPDKTVAHIFRVDENDSTKHICEKCGYSEAHSTTNFSYSSDEGTNRITVYCNEGGCDANIGYVELAAPSGTITYNGTKKEATVSDTVTGADFSSTPITYKQGGNTLSSAPEDAGTYTASITLGSATVSVEFTIDPATPEMTWGEASQSATYTGTEIVTSKLTPPNVTLKNSESYSGTFTYSYRVQDSSAAFTSGLPTDIGTYEVKASIVAGGNYTAAETTSTMTLTIDWLNTDAVAALTDQGGNSLNGNDWWAQSVTFTAPTGFTISNSLTGSYGTSFVYDTQTGADGITVTYYLKNSDGEIAEKTATVRIDRTAPTWPENGGISVKENWWKSLLNTISFGLFYQDETLDVKASAADDLSGVAAYYYYVDTTSSTTVLSSAELANRTFTEKAGSGTQTLTSLSSEGSYVVYAYAVDAVGNKSDYVCTNGVVLDRTAPTISGITAPSKEALTLTDTSAKISFTGSEAGTCFYMISETAPASIDDFATSDTDSQGMTVWTAKTGVSSVEMTTEAKQITLSNLSPNTTYTLYLAAVDKAGNSIATVESKSFTTCKTMPTITKNPTISGTYGQTVAGMTLTPGTAKVGSNVITGTWAVTDSNKTDVPVVGTTDTYQVTFTPDASYGDIYDTVIVPVKPNVSKRAITVTADNKAKTYGDANPELTFTITEGTLVGTDTEEALGITLTCAANASSPVKAGGYAITGTTNSANYQVTVIPGVLTITKADPTITASNYDKTYGDIKFFLDATDDSAEASLQYAVTESKDPSASPVEKDAVVTVDARGYVTIIGAGTAKITASLPETTNYNAASKEIAIVVYQAAYPPNMPGTAMFVSNSCTHVGDVPLTGDWEWQNGDTVLIPGENGATAVYIGADKVNYAYTTAGVSITKSHDCDHVAGEILYTVNGDYAPTCTTAGRGHRECTICGELIESGILVNPAHSFSSTWTIDVPATTTSEGSKSHHCSVCDAKNDITVIPKLVISSGDSSSGGTSSGSTTTETPAVEGPAVEAPATNKPNTTKKPAESKPDTEAPFIKGDNGKEGWDVIRDEVKGTTEGNTVVVDMNGASVVPGNVIADIRGKDITLVFDMGNGITWSINGKSITSDQIGDINFSVTVGRSSIPVDVINNVTGERYSQQISLAYDGEFGFTAVLSINMDKENAGRFANLFYYNEGTGELEFICYDEIAEDGIAELTFTHASEYTIVVDTVPMDGSAQALEETEATVTEAPKEKGGLPWWIILVCAIVIVAGVGVFFVVRKKTDDLDE